MERQIMFPGKNVENNFKMLSAKNFARVLSV